jgi:hypothetical protein
LLDHIVKISIPTFFRVVPSVSAAAVVVERPGRVSVMVSAAVAEGQ